jgi:hypothetical protein
MDFHQIMEHGIHHNGYQLKKTSFGSTTMAIVVVADGGTF